MRRMLVYHRSECTGCRLCELACSLRHKGINSRSDSLIKIITDDRNFANWALFCRHCKRPACMELCPVDAIVIEKKTGLVSVNTGECIGCGLCLECPLGGMHLDQITGFAVNCDLCGGNPACVEFCPTRALQFLLPEDARRSKIAAGTAV